MRAEPLLQLSGSTFKKNKRVSAADTKRGSEVLHYLDLKGRALTMKVDLLKSISNRKQIERVFTLFTQ